MDAGFSEEAIVDIVSFHENVENNGSWLRVGDKAAVGALLSQIGKVMTESAREEAKGLVGPEKEHRFEMVSGIAHFTYVAPTEQTRVNTDKVKAERPQKEHPDWWTRPQ